MFNIFSAFFLITILLMPGCLADSPLPAKHEVISAVVIEPAAVKLEILAAEKKNCSNTDKEFVTIAGNIYEIMQPWQGHKVIKDGFIEKPEFAPIPEFFAFEGSKIYIARKARNAFVRMAEAALDDGVILEVDSGYRSVSFQRRIFLKKMDEGKDFTDICRWVAPPGYSEHALGMVVDLTPSNWTFYNSRADKWLRRNAQDYAFHLSYPRKTDKGFAWEPWHWRYFENEEGLNAAGRHPGYLPAGR